MKDIKSFLSNVFKFLLLIVIIVFLGETAQRQERSQLPKVSNAFIVNNVIHRGSENRFYYSVRVEGLNKNVKAVFIIEYPFDQNWFKGDTLTLEKK